jgi:hypothetical protein
MAQQSFQSASLDIQIFSTLSVADAKHDNILSGAGVDIGYVDKFGNALYDVTYPVTGATLPLPTPNTGPLLTNITGNEIHMLYMVLSNSLNSVLGQDCYDTYVKPDKKREMLLAYIKASRNQTQVNTSFNNIRASNIRTNNNYNYLMWQVIGDPKASKMADNIAEGKDPYHGIQGYEGVTASSKKEKKYKPKIELNGSDLFDALGLENNNVIMTDATFYGIIGQLSSGPEDNNRRVFYLHSLENVCDSAGHSAKEASQSGIIVENIREITPDKTYKSYTSSQQGSRAFDFFSKNQVKITCVPFGKKDQVQQVWKYRTAPGINATTATTANNPNITNITSEVIDNPTKQNNKTTLHKLIRKNTLFLPRQRGGIPSFLPMNDPAHYLFNYYAQRKRSGDELQGICLQQQNLIDIGNRFCVQNNGRIRDLNVNTEYNIQEQPLGGGGVLLFPHQDDLYQHRLTDDTIITPIQGASAAQSGPPHTIINDYNWVRVILSQDNHYYLETHDVVLLAFALYLGINVFYTNQTKEIFVFRRY